MTRAIGYVLIASPFVGISAIMWGLMGPLAMIGVWVVTGLVCGAIIGGIALIDTVPTAGQE